MDSRMNDWDSAICHRPSILTLMLYKDEDVQKLLHFSMFAMLSVG